MRKSLGINVSPFLRDIEERLRNEVDRSRSPLQRWQIDNPWLLLPAQSPYVLEVDRQSIDQYNQSVHDDDKKDIAKSIPEPFIGNPRRARVVLLNLNPGHSEDDAKAHSDSNFRKAIIQNLQYEPQECPFYALSPKFAWTACGIWWRAHTRRLHEAGLSWEAISEGLFVIEWFPYHSMKGKRLPNRLVCPSQEYSFQLARDMLDKNLIVVGMRSKKYWLKVDQRVQEMPFLKESPESSHRSANTGAELFDRIVEALR